MGEGWNSLMGANKKNTEPPGMRPEDKTRDRLVLAACLVSFAAILAIDALTPVGLGIGVLYTIPVGLTILSKSERMTYAIAIICSVLVPIGYLISPSGGVAYNSYYNRAIALFLIWLMAYLAIQRKRTERSIEDSNEMLKEAKEGLEEKVDERTKELSESEALLKAVLETTTDPVFLKDRESRWLLANPALLQVVGKPLEEVLGKNDTEIYDDPEVGHNLMAIDRRIMDSGVGEVLEERVQTPAGYRTFLTTKTPHHDSDGKIIGIVGMARDITERKEMEDELRRSNAELQQFAYVASHDLKEPLRMVTSYLQLLERVNKNKLDDRSKEYMRFAMDGAKRMVAMIDDLLAYSRVETQGNSFTPVDMGEVLAVVLKDLKVSIEESGASITNDALPTAVADKSQMVLLLGNLIGNAVKYRGVAAPQIHVSAHEDGRDWVFSVSDNGIGIDPRYKDRLFKMFQRLHTRAEYEGTGMGLALSKRIVERHGGRIWFESASEEGTTFYFTIPKR